MGLTKFKRLTFEALLCARNLSSELSVGEGICWIFAMPKTCLKQAHFESIFCIWRKPCPAYVSVGWGIWGWDRWDHALSGLLLWPQVRLPSADAVLLRQTTVYNTPGCHLLSLPKQVRLRAGFLSEQLSCRSSWCHIKASHITYGLSQMNRQIIEKTKYRGRIEIQLYLSVLQNISSVSLV